MLIRSFEQQQAWIAEQRNRAIDSYPQLWQTIVKNWSAKDTENSLWLMYAANYLLKTADVHWAIDPYSLFSRVGVQPAMDYASTLASLELIVLTHWHSDHFDNELLATLGELPITWVIPEFMQSGIEKILPLHQLKVITPQALTPIYFKNLTLTPFKGLHFHGDCNGVPEMGYLFEFNDKRWLCPGDTRSYRPELLPDFGKLDGVLAHCWLGKAAALNPDTLEIINFCQFYSSMDTNKIVVTHLNEFGRDSDDLWTLDHFNLVKQCLQAGSERRVVVPALMGDQIIL